jgi:hypothetical protein
MPFEQFLERATRVKGAERRTIEGKELVVVGVVFDRSKEKDKGSVWDVEIQFDPAVNYLIRKMVFTAPGMAIVAGKPRTFRREEEVVQFKECSPGVFFPERLIGGSGPEGNFNFNHVTIISEIRVNQPLPEGTFRFRFPHGVELVDSTRGVRYPVDSKGNRIGPETPLAISPPPPPVDSPPPSQQLETQEEPQGWSRWIFWVSLGIVLLAGGGLLYRHWRGKAARL